MSQVFDALQRTETKRSGLDPAKLTSAAELLQLAERQAVHMPIEGDGREDDHHGGGSQTAKPNVGQWTQFPSSQVMVPPQSKLVCITDEDSLAAEKFRFLGVRLRHLQQKRPVKRLLITSSMTEEGKSMVSANLACTLARKQQQKILLLEGDLRRPTLAEQFGLGKVPGLSELLEGEPPCMAMNIRQLPSLGLWILPAGSPSRAPLELMQSRKLSTLMDQLDAWFDWIVIDSPPLMPLGDTSVWMRLADGILLVTRPGKTAKRQLKRGLEAIEQSKLLGAVLNSSADAGLGDYYRYYGQATALHASSQPA